MSPRSASTSPLRDLGDPRARGPDRPRSPRRPDPRDIGALIAEREVGVAMLSPGMLTELVRSALPELGGMRILSSGGDVLPPRPPPSCAPPIPK